MSDNETPNQDNNEGLQNLLTKFNNDWAALAGELYSQTGQLREKRRTLESQVQTLTGERDTLRERVPKDGSRVLSKADGERFDALMGIEADGVKGDAVKITESLNKGAQAAKNAHSASVKESLRELGYTPTDRLIKDFADVSLSIKTDKDAQGKEVKVATVKSGDTETPFAEWSKQAGLAEDLERYRAAPSAPNALVLPQHRGDPASNLSGTSKIVDDLNATRAARPNPLLKGDTSNGTKNQELS